MRSIYYLLFLITFISCKTSQTNTAEKEQSNDVLFQVNDEPVYADEFMYAYKKSAKNKGSLEDVDDYLELYINFKLKVADARKQGIDTLASYKDELTGYLKDIKKPYLTAEKVNEALLEETYNRLQQEIKASHILVQVSSDATPSDTLKAFNKLLAVKTAFQEGASFEELAVRNSEDPSAKQNQGSLGWFTAFQMVYPFESAAYNTPKGEVSNIIRTQFGYHLINVKDKRETSGKIKVAHIMLRFPAAASVEDSLKIKKKIYQIHNQLIEGENWFSLAVEYSEDLNSKDAGGSLPWFGVGSLPKSMENAAFKLSQTGQISSPVKSPYGWHIIKLEEKRGIGSFENMRESLSRRVQRDQRSELKTSEVIDKLKLENNFLKNEDVYIQLRSQKELSALNLPSSLLKQTLFSIANQSYSVEDFINQANKGSSFEKEVVSYEKRMLLDYEDNHLGEKYPEYKMLSSEYKDGLLLFEIMNQKVWNRISTDTVEMKEFYFSRQKEYISPLRVSADIFHLTDTLDVQDLSSPLYDSLYESSPKAKVNLSGVDFEIPSFIKPTIDTIYCQLYLPGNFKDENIQLLKNRLIKENKNINFLKPVISSENEIYLQLFRRPSKYLKDYYKSIISIESGIYDAQNLLNTDDKIGVGHSKLTTEDGQIHLINVEEIIEPKPLNFEEAKSDLITDYQAFLEKNWIKQLRKENKVTVNQSVLNKLKEEIEN